MANDCVGGCGCADACPCGDQELPAALGSRRGPSSAPHSQGHLPPRANDSESPDYSAWIKDYLEDPTSVINDSSGLDVVQEGYTPADRYDESGYHTGQSAVVSTAFQLAPESLLSDLPLALPSSSPGCNFGSPVPGRLATTVQRNMGTIATSQVPSDYRPQLNVLKRHAADDYNDEAKMLPLNDRHKHARYTISQRIPLRPEQATAINSLRTLCEIENRLPGEGELRNVAGYVGLSLVEVAMLVGEKIGLTREPPASASPILPPSVSTVPGSTNEQVKREIKTYVRERRSKGCASMSPAERRNKTAAKYHCTLGCGYASDKKGDWIRHEEERQPQEFWHCIVCRRMGVLDGVTKPFISHRSDKIKKHIDTRHADDDRASLREASKVAYETLTFDRQCTFVTQDNLRCTFWSETWRQRNDHYASHFGGKVSGGPWYGPGGNDGDDDNGSGSGRGPGPSSKHPGGHSTLPGSSNGRNSGSRSGANGYSFGGSGTQFASSYAAFGHPHPSSLLHIPVSPIENGHNGGPIQHRNLLDIRKWRVVPEPLETRFLALHCSSMTSKSATRNGPTDLWLTTLQRSARLTIELGFQYLWVDGLCVTDAPHETSITTFSQAVMIIIMLETDNLADRIWHFTCRYSNFTEVLRWASKKASFQSHRLLGHGAYGIVDKVEVKLASLSRVFARKVVLNAGTNARHAMGVSPLHEVTLMQKFNHPHIARFVAAYSDSESFNILMEPIADCDLRQFLNNAEQRSIDKVQMKKWFLSLASALAHIHTLNCRHKDIKPANVLISRGNVFLSDFGTSNHYPEDDTKTSGGAYMTPKYCAPEVASQGERGRKADVFSLGCVYAEMIVIARGDTLGTFHASIGFAEQSDVRNATYHTRHKAVTKHMASSAVHATNRYLLTETLLCVEMLDNDPGKRPSALDLVGKLMNRQEYNVDTEIFGCPCCPIINSSQLDERQLDLDTSNRPRPGRRDHYGRGSAFGLKKHGSGVRNVDQHSHDKFQPNKISTRVPPRAPWRGSRGQPSNRVQLLSQMGFQSPFDKANSARSFSGVDLADKDEDGTQKLNKLLTYMQLDDSNSV